MKKILIDTDVLLDFLFDRKPFSDNASQLLSKCETGELKGYVTAIMLSNAYYLLRKTSGHQKVIDSLKMLMNFLEVSKINKNIVLEALNSDFKDFEDALQNYSAQQEKGLTLIITRNIKDYKNSRLAVMTPEDYLKTF
jgi:predicted nucleic acid-binding protein